MKKHTTYIKNLLVAVIVSTLATSCYYNTCPTYARGKKLGTYHHAHSRARLSEGQLK